MGEFFSMASTEIFKTIVVTKKLNGQGIVVLRALLKINFDLRNYSRFEAPCTSDCKKLTLYYTT